MKPPPCCERFALFRADPARYLRERGAALDLDRAAGDLSRRVTLTARGLFLTRDLTVEHDPEERYDRHARTHAPPRWDRDTYLGGLCVRPETIRPGARILDVGAGLAVFGTELSELDAAVTCVDLEIGAGHPALSAAKRHVERHYAEALDLLACLADHGGEERYALSGPERAMLDALRERAGSIAARYPEVSGERTRGDARDLDGVETSGFDVVTCGWLFVHLDEEDERRAIASLARVTRPGGRLHLRAGYGGDLARRVEAWFPGLAAGGKRLEIEVAAGDLAVLAVR